MNSEFEDLLRAVSYAPADGPGIAEMLTRGYPVGQGTPNVPSTERISKRTESDVASTAVEVSRLIQIAEASTVNGSQSTGSSQSSSTKETEYGGDGSQDSRNGNRSRANRDRIDETIRIARCRAASGT